jgi:Fur family ferric uptake transcriptional regulator
VKVVDPRLREVISDELRTAGLRATPARVGVLSVLRSARAPMTHSDVVDELDGHGWDRATIFRNLVTLTEEGFVSRTDVGDHVWRFEAVAEDQPTHEHPHFLCTACGAVECIPSIEVKHRRGAKVPRAVREREIEVQLKGVCDACS